MNLVAYKFLLLLVTLPLAKTSTATPPLLAAGASAPISSGNPGSSTTQDSATATSNHHSQYMMPPNVYPGAGPPYQMPVQQYRMQPPMENTQNSMAEIRSDISTLRDTVLLLSNVVKQNAVNSRPQDQDQYEDAEPEQRHFRNPEYGPQNQGNYPPPSDHHNYDTNYQNEGGYQNKKGYQEQQPGPKSILKKLVKDIKPLPVITTKIETKADIKLPALPSLNTGRTAVSQAQRTFAIIKRGMKNALVTGLIVAIVKLAPLLWVGLRLIFNGILPLVGISMMNRPPGSSIFSKSIHSSTSYDSKRAPVSADTPVTTTPTTSNSISNDELDDELANLETSFDLFKAGLY